MARLPTGRTLARFAIAAIVAPLMLHAVTAAPVTGERIVAADSEPQNWLAHGRTYGEQRYSPLTQVDDGNVGKLGLAWSYATGTLRGLQATPIVIDGRLYATGVWSVVYALDAKTGKPLWTFDPEVPRAWAVTPAATRSTAAWPPGATRSTSARSTVGSSRSTHAPVASSGK